MSQMAISCGFCKNTEKGSKKIISPREESIFQLQLLKPVLQHIHFVFIINTGPLFVAKGEKCL